MNLVYCNLDFLKAKIEGILQLSNVGRANSLSGLEMEDSLKRLGRLLKQTCQDFSTMQKTPDELIEESLSDNENGEINLSIFHIAKKTRNRS